MVSCGLKILPYWTATFIIDIIIWIIISTIIWFIFLIVGIRCYLDNVFTTWYVFILAGPSFLLMIYSLSFVYNKVETAVRQVYIGMAFLLIIPLIIDMVRMDEAPLWLEFFYSLFPHVSIMRILSKVLVNISFFKKSSYIFNYF